MAEFVPPAFHPNRPGVVAPVRRDLSGVSGPTEAQARSSAWRRTSRGLYVPSSVDADSVAQRVVEAAAVLPPYGGVTGWAALAWLGGRWFEGRTPDGGIRPVVLACGPDDIRPQPGITPSAERLNPRDLTVHDGLRITTAVRSVCFEMRYAPTDRLAVAVLDMAAFNDLVSRHEVAAYALGLNGWTGVPRCRDALLLADENSWSIAETLMRLVWVCDARRPRPLCNVPVFDLDGHHIGTPDLLDPVAGIVGQYDGALHLQGTQRHKDIQRDEAFRAHGLETVTMVAADGRDPHGFIQRLHAAYARAPRLSQGDRSWTIEPPAWWVPTLTVAQRRALSEDQRRRFLRLRAA
jgi:hypothetical protein